MAQKQVGTMYLLAVRWMLFLFRFRHVSHLPFGVKGAGKGTMILDSMEAISAEGVAICEAHPDLEVFRSVLSYTYSTFFCHNSFELHVVPPLHAGYV
jgi:late competence protein required for DNA uptake (superfamily II DNA/RNA helicase)